MPKEIRKKSIDTIERMAHKSTRWIGSVNSILIHTALFMASFTLYFFGVNFNKILLIVTTIVSLEAIYLAIFIQMSVNMQSQRLRRVSRDIDEIQEDIDDIQESVDEIQEDVDEIQEDVDEIQGDVDEIQEDVEEIEEDDEEAKLRDKMMLQKIEIALAKMSEEISELRKITNKTDKK